MQIPRAASFNMCSFCVSFLSFTRTKVLDCEENRLSARNRPNSSQDLIEELNQELVTQREHVWYYPVPFSACSKPNTSEMSGPLWCPAAVRACSWQRLVAWAVCSILASTGAWNGLFGPAVPLSSLWGAQALSESVVSTRPSGVQPHLRDPVCAVQVQQRMRCRCAAPPSGWQSPRCRISFSLPRTALLWRRAWAYAFICNLLPAQCGVSSGRDPGEDSHELWRSLFLYREQRHGGCR